MRIALWKDGLRRKWTGAQRCIGHRGTQDALGQCMHWARCPDGELACSVSRCACCAASTVQLRTATENKHKCSFMMSRAEWSECRQVCAQKRRDEPLMEFRTRVGTEAGTIVVLY